MLALLNGYASNVTAVNIDNGFGVGFLASLINRQRPDPTWSALELSVFQMTVD